MYIYTPTCQWCFLTEITICVWINPNINCIVTILFIIDSIHLVSNIFPIDENAMVRTRRLKYAHITTFAFLTDGCFFKKLSTIQSCYSKPLLVCKSLLLIYKINVHVSGLSEVVLYTVLAIHVLWSISLWNIKVDHTYYCLQRVSYWK